MPAFDLERHLPVNPVEREVLRLVARNLTHAEIAEELTVSVDAVHSRVRRFRQKHGFQPGESTAPWAVRHESCCLAEDATP